MNSIDIRFKYIEIDNLRQPDPGPSRARNAGIQAALGEFVAFCDDDDRWIRSDHLSVAVDSLKNNAGDLYFAALRYSENLSDPFLYTPAIKLLTKNKISENIYEVDILAMAKFLSLRTLHCDTIVVRKQILLDAGLYNEKIRISEDREFSYRLIGSSSKILFRSEICAELNISPHTSIFRTTSLIDQYLLAYQASIKAIFIIKNDSIRKAALKTAAWDMIQLSELFIEQSDRRNAFFAMKQSIMTYPTFYCVKLWLKAVIRLW